MFEARNHPSRYIAYYRVSTKRQGTSGLGLEAQRAAVESYLSGNTGSVVADFTEIESGRRSERPALMAALEACHVHQAVLLVAKLDRLARNAHFLLGLKNAGIEFVCCDMPSANRMTVGILAVVAEEEAKTISERTKAALAAAKARGVKLGSPGNLTDAGRAKGAQRGSESLSRSADKFANRVQSQVAALSETGITGTKALARALNDRNIPARRGGKWTATQVQRLLNRLEL